MTRLTQKGTMSQESASDLQRRGPKTDFPTLANIVRDTENVLITSHVQADGDAVGSTVALALGLQWLGKKAQVLLCDLPFLPNC